VDVLQIGARNMQNFELLKIAGRSSRPVLLKRGMNSTIEEFLLSAEYILNEGNQDVVLCERGIRTFEKYTRNTFDISCIPLVKEISHLPIIADPSHASGRRDLIIPLAKSALVTGTDGIIVEVHPEPKKALSDGPQSLNFKEFEILVRELKELAEALKIKWNQTLQTLKR
jgi:3-deoxy-7-phosphoheptulonate synthase